MILPYSTCVVICDDGVGWWCMMVVMVCDDVIIINLKCIHIFMNLKLKI